MKGIALSCTKSDRQARCERNEADAQPHTADPSTTVIIFSLLTKVKALQKIGWVDTFARCYVETPRENVETPAGEKRCNWTGPVVLTIQFISNQGCHTQPPESSFRGSDAGSHSGPGRNRSATAVLLLPFGLVSIEGRWCEYSPSIHWTL